MAAKVANPVTKSVRFCPEESELIAQVSQREHLPEGTLLRKLVLDGLARYRLEQAIGDYEAGELSLGQAVRRGGVSVARMMAELDRRGISLGGEDHVIASLDNLAALFGGSPELVETLGN
jgi:predicted HTH domain antitoxin